jgi:hypothetical protein
VQRRLTGLSFDTKVTGKFDENTRAVITRWQAARGCPNSGFLNKLQHEAVVTIVAAVAQAASSAAWWVDYSGGGEPVDFDGRPSGLREYVRPGLRER